MADVVKYGVQIPNRIFVGGIAFDTKEDELKQFFQQHGKVKDCKIVSDKDGFSRGFGFITFESKQEAIQTQKLGTVFFNQKKLNLGPAIRQKGVVFNAAQEAANEPVPSAGVYIHPSGYCYTVASNGMWYFHDGSSEDGVPSTQPPEVAVPTTQANSANTTPAPITTPNIAHMPTGMPAQSPPTVLPIKYMPPESISQPNCPVYYSHYVIPQNVPLANTSTIDPGPRYFGDSNMMPYYITQPQPQIAPMNIYPIASPPSQINHVPHPSLHLIQGPTHRQPMPVAPPRPEVYQIYSAPYDPSIIEQGPFIHPNSKTISPGLMKPAMIRPPYHMKRMTNESAPPYTYLRRSYEVVLNNSNGNGIRVNSGSGGSTPASSSTSSGGENGLEHKE